MPPTLLGFWGHQPCPPSVPFGDKIGKMIAFRSLQALEVSRGEILGCCLYGKAWEGMGWAQRCWFGVCRMGSHRADPSLEERRSFQDMKFGVNSENEWQLAGQVA